MYVFLHPQKKLNLVMFILPDFYLSIVRLKLKEVLELQLKVEHLT